MGCKRIGRSVALFAVVGMLAAACSANGGTPTPPVVTLGAPWQAVFSQIRPDGTVSAQTALQAFSLAFGQLPEVTVPPGEPGTIPSGSAALRWLVGRWGEITKEQREAAAALKPELKALLPGGSAAPAAPAYRIAPGRSDPDAQAAVQITPTQQRSDFFYTQLAQQLAQDIAARVGRSLTIPIQAKVGPTQDSTSVADTAVLNKSGGFTGTPAKCVITVSPAGDAFLGDDVGWLIAHETWHCFEGEIAGLDRYYYGPSWLIEGQAAWVCASLYPNAPNNASYWPEYLNEPGKSLFTRAYSAMGFYSQLASAGVNVWSKLIPILLAKTNETAFVAADADQDAFLDRWASGYARENPRGAPWEITGPGIISGRPTPALIQAPDGVSVSAKAAKYTNAIYAITDNSAEVLQLVFSGHARVSDSAGRDYLVQGAGTFCHRAGGCACPNADPNSPPMLDLSAPNILLGVTGGTAGSEGTVTGFSLKNYCTRGPLSGTWTGTWRNDNGLATGTSTMVLVQKGNVITGTAETAGKTCVRTGPITGTVSGNKIHLVHQSVRTVTMDGTIKGASASGTWSAPSCGPPYGPANVTVTVTGTWQATKVN